MREGGAGKGGVRVLGTMIEACGGGRGRGMEGGAWRKGHSPCTVSHFLTLTGDWRGSNTREGVARRANSAVMTTFDKASVGGNIGKEEGGGR